MARRRPDVTMAGHWMPVRPFSAGSLVCVAMLASLAARVVAGDTAPTGGAAAAAEGRPQAKTERTVEVRRRPEVTPRAAPESKPTGAAADPRPRSQCPRPARPTPSASPTACTCARPAARWCCSPAARVQVDGAVFPRQTPKSGVFVRRARVELARLARPHLLLRRLGRLRARAPVGGDRVAPSALPADRRLPGARARSAIGFIVQAGQFDAPFTLENRTSDAYTDFIERSMVARSLGAPRNKEVGVMAARPARRRRLLLLGRRLQRRRARASATSTTSPTPSAASSWRRSRGGDGDLRGACRSAARPGTGSTCCGPTFPVQATPGGSVVLRPALDDRPAGAARSSCASTAPSTAVRRRAQPADRHPLRPARRSGLQAAAARRGRRVAGRRPDHAASARATLDGHRRLRRAVVLAAGRRAACCPRPGCELPARLERRYRRAVRATALMLAVRGEVLKEDLTSDQPTLGDPNRATTRVVSGTAGAQLLARRASCGSRSTTSSTIGAARRRRSRRCAAPGHARARAAASLRDVALDLDRRGS